MSDPPKVLADGRYELLDRIGSGGMASVFLAIDHRLEVRRAIKLLKPELKDSARLLARFEREARLMARLEHPHIVPVHDIGTEQGHTYIVMSLLQGGSLVDHLQRYGALPARQAVDATLGVLEALRTAHEHGVVHRDVKPHNVLIDGEGRVRLTDFGIARDPGTPGLTRTGSVMGTWAYMAPEQRHSAKDIGPSADVYATGALVLHLLSGVEPHELHTAESRSEQLAGIPARLADFITTCTQFRPEQRYADAGEAHAALRAMAARLPPVPPDTPALGSGWSAPGEVPGSFDPRRTSETLLAWMEGETPLSEPGPTAVPDPGARVLAEAETEVQDPVHAQTVLQPPQPATPIPPPPRQGAPVVAPLVAGVGAFGGVLAIGVIALVGYAAWTPSEDVAPRGVPSVQPLPVEPIAVEPPAVAPVVEPVVPVVEPVEPLPVDPTAPRPAAPVPSAPEPTVPPPVAPPSEPARPLSGTPVPAEPTPSPAPVGPTGRLRVSSKPVAQASIGDQTFETPAVIELPVGEHRIRLQPADGEAIVRVVGVREGELARFCFDFDEGGPCF